MANLLMLVIVVFLSSLLFIWSVNSISAYQTGAGLFFSNRGLASQERLVVENVWYYNETAGQDDLHIFIRNIGTVAVKLSFIYIDGRQKVAPAACQTILVGQSVECAINKPGGPVNLRGQLIKIIIATDRGSVFFRQWVV